ncbi:MAG: type II toxin-antitoxin system RelE/ParE family toxin [Deltaproteobacteria bacterium]|nr:type II toxin-antitoxin system RelE/ParE family toxin [Deltaproteobacteria bacterium]
MEAIPKKVEFYVTAKGKMPFRDWLESLRDIKGRAQVNKRLRYVELGNLGEYNTVGQGVYEMKIHFGPGYRIYFGMEGQRLVILLCGGDKSNQFKDIKLAHEYWAEWRAS